MTICYVTNAGPTVHTYRHGVIVECSIETLLNDAQAVMGARSDMGAATIGMLIDAIEVLRAALSEAQQPAAALAPHPGKTDE